MGKNPFLPLMLFTGTVTDFRLPGDTTPLLGVSAGFQHGGGVDRGGEGALFSDF